MKFENFIPFFGSLTYENQEFTRIEFQYQMRSNEKDLKPICA